MTSLSASGVYHECNRLCTIRHAGELMAKIVDNDLFLKINSCVYECMDDVNRRLRKNGNDELVEPNSFLVPFIGRWNH